MLEDDKEFIDLINDQIVKMSSRGDNLEDNINNIENGEEEEEQEEMEGVDDVIENFHEEIDLKDQDEKFLRESQSLLIINVTFYLKKRKKSS